VSVKLVSEVGVGTIAAGVAKAGAGGVTVSGYEGGTGASPISSIKHAGLPWELGLAEAQQVLVMNRLRNRIRLQVDGGLRTSRDVTVAALLGAEEFGLATASLIVEGCVMLRKCHLNTCSVGVATQDPRLREHFHGRAEDLVTFFTFIAEGVRRHLASLGFKSVEDAVGRVERLRQRTDVGHWKARRLDLSALLTPPVDGPRSCQVPQQKDLSGHLDHALLARAKDATAVVPVTNAHRAVGAMLSGELVRKHGAAGLADDSLHLRLRGSAGQANDSVAKGLSGGRVIIAPPHTATFAPEENVIVGNTALYGATAGEAYFSGLAGERFAVRNSGATAVVEGVGDHGCEYMTGGVVVVLGPTGRNFAAGMSGGTAYVLDRARTFKPRCNLEMVELESLVDESEIWLVYGLVESHLRLTRSPLAQRVLDNWEHLVGAFVKVMPTDYRKVLQARRAQRLRPPTSAPRLRAVGGSEG
jgi:glutamate synthase (NADPH/NADH) large chain